MIRYLIPGWFFISSFSCLLIFGFWLWAVIDNAVKPDSFYENYSIDLTDWSLCGDELLFGYVNHSDGGVYLNTTKTIPAYGYALITDGGSGTDVYKNFNVNSKHVRVFTLL